MGIKYIDKDLATVEQLQPGARLYLDALGGFKCVARIGMADDWAAYIVLCGASFSGESSPENVACENWTLDDVADHGHKLHENYANKIFPICGQAGLKYRP